MEAVLRPDFCPHSRLERRRMTDTFLVDSMIKVTEPHGPTAVDELSCNRKDNPSLPALQTAILRFVSGI